LTFSTLDSISSGACRTLGEDSDVAVAELLGSGDLVPAGFSVGSNVGVETVGSMPVSPEHAAKPARKRRSPNENNLFMD
jgi:hypothetical protein